MSVTNPKGAVHKREYDPVGRVVHVLDFDGNDRRPGSYTHLADGNLTERYLGTGKWLDGKKDRWRYRWNADGSLAKVVRGPFPQMRFAYS